jgi:hypothetical protein
VGASTTRRPSESTASADRVAPGRPTVTGVATRRRITRTISRRRPGNALAGTVSAMANLPRASVPMRLGVPAPSRTAPRRLGANPDPVSDTVAPGATAAGASVIDAPRAAAGNTVAATSRPAASANARALFKGPSSGTAAGAERRRGRPAASAQARPGSDAGGRRIPSKPRKRYVRLPPDLPLLSPAADARDDEPDMAGDVESGLYVVLSVAAHPVPSYWWDVRPAGARSGPHRPGSAS